MPEFPPDDDEPTTDRIFRIAPVRRPDLPDLDAVAAVAEGAEFGAVVEFAEFGAVVEVAAWDDESSPGRSGADDDAGAVVTAARFEPAAPGFPVCEPEPERDRRRWLAASLAGLVVAAGFATLGLVQDAPIAPGARADAGVSPPSTPAPVSVTNAPAVADAGPDAADADGADDGAAKNTADAAKPAAGRLDDRWREKRKRDAGDDRSAPARWKTKRFNSDTGGDELPAGEGSIRYDADRE